MDTISQMAGHSFVSRIPYFPHFLQHVLQHFLLHIVDLLWKKLTENRKNTSTCLPHSPYPHWAPESSKTGRTVVESELFSAQCRELGNAQRIDEALLEITYTLALCPEDYPVEPGTQGSRVVCIPYVEWAGDIVQTLRISFRIELNKTVLLLTIDQLENLDDDLCTDADEATRNVTSIIPS